jgi:hypothetical protein
MATSAPQPIMIIHTTEGGLLVNTLPELWDVSTCRNNNGILRRNIWQYRDTEHTGDRREIVKCANGNWALIPNGIPLELASSQSDDVLNGSVATLPIGTVLYDHHQKDIGVTYISLGEAITCLYLPDLCLDGVGPIIQKWMKQHDITSVVCGNRYHPMSTRPFSALPTQEGSIPLNFQSKGGDRYRVRLGTTGIDDTFHTSRISAPKILSSSQVATLRTSARV